MEGIWIVDTNADNILVLRSIRALERRYEIETNIELSDGALYD